MGSTKMKRMIYVSLCAILLTLNLCALLPNMIPVMAQDEVSEITLMNIVIPNGTWTLTVNWGGIVKTLTINSTIHPIQARVPFERANIRQGLEVAILGANRTLLKFSLLPYFGGYRFTSLWVGEGVEFTDSRIGKILETVSTATVTFEISGIEDVKASDIELKVNGEELIPIIESVSDGIRVSIGSIVVDPGEILDLSLDASTFRVIGSITLVRDRLVASGTAEGGIQATLMRVRHSMGKVTFSANLPILEMSAEQVVEEQTTDIIIRRGIPESVEITVVVADESGKPIKGANVKITSADSTLMAEGLTDENGVIRLPVKNATRVDVSITHEKYDSYQGTVNLLTSQMLRVRLEKAKGFGELIADSIREGIRSIRPYSIPLLILGAVAVVAGVRRYRHALVFLGLSVLVTAIASITI